MARLTQQGGFGGAIAKSEGTGDGGMSPLVMKVAAVAGACGLAVLLGVVFALSRLTVYGDGESAKPPSPVNQVASQSVAPAAASTPTAESTSPSPQSNNVPAAAVAERPPAQPINTVVDSQSISSPPTYSQPSPSSTKDVHVDGYYRKDGTYVHSYDRASPGFGSGRSRKR